MKCHSINSIAIGFNFKEGADFFHVEFPLTTLDIVVDAVVNDVIAMVNIGPIDKIIGFSSFNLRISPTFKTYGFFTFIV